MAIKPTITLVKQGRQGGWGKVRRGQGLDWPAGHLSVQCKLRSAKQHGMSDQFEGGCLCGAVGFAATGRPGYLGLGDQDGLSLPVRIGAPIGTKKPIPEIVDHRKIAIGMPVMEEMELLLSPEPGKSSQP
jgi:hypothetical protein